MRYPAIMSRNGAGSDFSTEGTEGTEGAEKTVGLSLRLAGRRKFAGCVIRHVIQNPDLLEATFCDN